MAEPWMFSRDINMTRENVKDFFENPHKEAKNPAARPSAFQDWGIWNMETDSLTPVGLALKENKISWKECILLLLSKRSSRTDVEGAVKPLVVLCKTMKILLNNGIDSLCKSACAKYLISINSYEDIEPAATQIIADPNPEGENSYLDIWFNALVEAELFAYPAGRSKSTIYVAKTQYANAVIQFIATYGDSISLTPAKDHNKPQYYAYLGAMNTGFIELLSPLRKLTEELPTLCDFVGKNKKKKCDSKYPWNRIFFGAPGTGKSHCLKEEAEGFSEIIERVTFYPNYSYAQFVGTYKPVMKQKTDASGNEEITYAYVPGPFIRQWIKAKTTSAPVLLIIEELNRANAPAVFGDMFQLLDRKKGESEYPIATSEDLRKYLNSIIAPDGATDEEIEEKGYLPNGTNVNEITIPPNMYIWATMNSADQGVFPLDTAFKRRWDYKYFSVYDRKENWPDDIDVQKVVLHGHQYEWGTIREKINDFLAKKNVNEDKFIGPYFISDTVFSADTQKKVTENFIDAFNDKVIMYLFEDAARQYRKDMFQLKDSKLPLVYSQICKQFKESGFSIFKFDIPAENQETTAVEGSNE